MKGPGSLFQLASVILNNPPMVLLYFSTLEAMIFYVNGDIFQLFFQRRSWNRLFAILGRILGQLGGQMDPKSIENSIENWVEILMIFWWILGRPGGWGHATNFESTQRLPPLKFKLTTRTRTRTGTRMGTRMGMGTRTGTWREGNLETWDRSSPPIGSRELCLRHNGGYSQIWESF